MKRLFIIGTILMFLTGCSMQTNDREKLRDLEFTVMEDGQMPQELQAIIEEKKKEEFKVTFEDADSLYLCIGYGEQSTGGYSITVNELYLSENAVYFDTNLIGPSKEDKISETASFPCLVVKTEYVDKPVVFQ